MWSFSFKFFMNSSCAFFFPPDIRAYSRRYCLFRCWIYRKFPIYWGISSTSWTWGTSYLQFGKHVPTWFGKCWYHIRLLLELSFCTFSKLPRFDYHLIEWFAYEFFWGYYYFSVFENDYITCFYMEWIFAGDSSVDFHFKDTFLLPNFVAH